MTDKEKADKALADLFKKFSDPVIAAVFQRLADR